MGFLLPTGQPTGTVVQSPAHGVGGLGIEKKVMSIGVEGSTVGTMGTSLALWALSPNQEFSVRFHSLLLGCSGQAVPARGTEK